MLATLDRPALTALSAGAPAVKTYVVGFGSEVDPTELQAMAAGR